MRQTVKFHNILTSFYFAAFSLCLMISEAAAIAVSVDTGATKIYGRCWLANGDDVYTSFEDCQERRGDFYTVEYILSLEQ